MEVCRSFACARKLADGLPVIRMLDTTIREI